jgi:hypothetical protein
MAEIKKQRVKTEDAGEYDIKGANAALSEKIGKQKIYFITKKVEALQSEKSRRNQNRIGGRKLQYVLTGERQILDQIFAPQASGSSR